MDDLCSLDPPGSSCGAASVDASPVAVRRVMRDGTGVGARESRVMLEDEVETFGTDLNMFTIVHNCSHIFTDRSCRESEFLRCIFDRCLALRKSRFWGTPGAPMRLETEPRAQQGPALDSMSGPEKRCSCCSPGNGWSIAHDLWPMSRVIGCLEF